MVPPKLGVGSGTLTISFHGLVLERDSPVLILKLYVGEISQGHLPLLCPSKVDVRFFASDGFSFRDGELHLMVHIPDCVSP